MMNNTEISHAYFYQEETGRTSGSANSMHFKKNLFYSYSTCIARILENNGKKYLFLTDCNYSRTTSKHIYNLQRACNLEIIDTPSEALKYYTCFNDTEFLEQCKKHILEKLKHYTDKKHYMFLNFAYKANRDKFLNAIRQAEGIARFIKFSYRKYENIAKKINSGDLEEYKKANKKALARKKRQEEAKAKAEAKKLKEINKNISIYIEALQNYSNETDPAKKLEMQRKRSVLNNLKIDNYFLSYVWYSKEENAIKTSQSIKIEGEDIKKSYLLLKRYFQGKTILGEKVKFYNVVKSNNEFVKVGCHVLIKSNLKLLLEQLEAIFAEGNR